MKDFFQKQNNFSGGFTLIETLVAISVLMVAIAAPLTLVQKSLSTASLATEQITASFLAQDALEYVQSVRDRNIGKPDWLGGLSSSCGEPEGCLIDSGVGTVIKCSTSGCANLLYYANFGLYNHSNAGDPSKYKRKTTIKTVDANQASVVTTVSWSGIFGERQITLKKQLFKWQQ